MVKINKIAPPTLQIYTPNGELLGTVNEYEFLDIRVQIKKQQVSGYYGIFNGERINIDRNGELEKYPNGLLDTMTGYYLELT
jgi:sporulation protein YlmC with PRC-barrel domain